ncbi:MAG: hypothetical protein AAF570_28515, partial [Bacteroidota bacterium]
QKVYDQDKLLHKFRNDDFVKHFSSAKNYLYKTILKSLRAYRAEKNAHFQIRELQSDAAILQEKGLYKQALKQIRKAKKLGEHYELNLPLLEILQTEKWLVKKVGKKSAGKESEVIVQQINQRFDQLVPEIQYGVVFDRFYFAQEKMNTHADVNAHLQRMIKTTFDEHENASFHSRHLELQIRGLYAHLQGDMEGTQGCLRDARLLWEAHPQMISLYPAKYKLILRNCLRGQSFHGNEALFAEIVQKIEALPEGAPESEIAIQKDLLYTQLLFHLNTGEFSVGMELVPRIRAFLDQHGSKLPDLWILAFYYNLCLLHFVGAAPEKALRWANAILNFERPDVRKDVQFSIRLMRLLIHHDLGNAE